MIKRTLYFGNPAYLKTRDAQLVITIPGANGRDELVGNTIPIEDIGVLILDHQQITITQVLLDKLLANNVAVITCNDKRHPSGLLLPLDVNSVQQERFEAQVSASEPLKKQLWQQTIKAKIRNQAAVLKKNGSQADHLLQWANGVLSGDTGNVEARAAVYYWQHLFGSRFPFFTRNRFGEYPNNILNYGYSILRATVARGLVGSGLLPTLGIHHRNKYNAYCLADDIMEPYRPYVDEVVLDIVNRKGEGTELDTETKKQLLLIPAIDVCLEGNRSPLMVGLQRTTASLARCFLGETRKVIYPEL